jgi:hypothetical protein
MRLIGQVVAAVAAAALFGLGAVACDDTSDYDSDSSTSSDPDGDGYYSPDDSYNYDDTPDGRFNPTPPQGPYSP